MDVFANVEQRDLGGVASDVQKIVKKNSQHLPPGVEIVLSGQVLTMNTSFANLEVGIAAAVVFVYLLMAMNFQSWTIPFIILMALPGAFAGIVWMLFLTQTTFNVPSLMGALMTIGVATANSILVVSFANESRGEGENRKDAKQAALIAGSTRLRPVCMTALAMIIGMLPMALALGEGGEQNAPIGRAVIGGLLFATVGTLFIVPVMYSLMSKQAPVNWEKRLEDEIQGSAAMSTDCAPTPAAGNRQHEAQPQQKRGRRMLWVLIAVVVLALALLLGWLPHYKRNKEVNARAQQEKNALPVVEVQRVHTASSEQELTLPGTVTPLRSAHIYAQASGYLKARYVDLGDTVRKGQLLGVISAPELDASVAQAAAAVQQNKDNVLTAQSTLQLQQATYTRVHTLVLHGILSRQEDDTARAAVESAQSNLQAMENAVKGAQEALARAQALADFEQVRSPINGTITARNVEVGNLVSASGAAQGLAAVPAALHRRAADGRRAGRRIIRCCGSRQSGGVCVRAGAGCAFRADRPACGPHLFGVAGQRHSRARWFGAAILSASRLGRCSPRSQVRDPAAPVAAGHVRLRADALQGPEPWHSDLRR